jgi:hypothetical protein
VVSQHNLLSEQRMQERLREFRAIRISGAQTVGNVDEIHLPTSLA